MEIRNRTIPIQKSYIRWKEKNYNNNNKNIKDNNDGKWKYVAYDIHG